MTYTGIELRINVWESSTLTTEPRLSGKSHLSYFLSYTARWYSNARVLHLTYLTLHSNRAVCFLPTFKQKPSINGLVQAYNPSMHVRCSVTTSLQRGLGDYSMSKVRIGRSIICKGMQNSPLSRGRSGSSSEFPHTFWSGGLHLR